MGAVIACLALPVGASTLRAQQPGPGEVVMRPVISEEVAPVEAIAPVAADGYAGEAFLRKPPGEGPFPVVVLIHGGAPRWPTGELREFAVHTHASRFLEAGYVVAVITRRDLNLALPSTEEQEPVRDAVAAIMVEEPFSMPFVGLGGGGGSRDLVELYRTSGNDEKIARLDSPILLVRGDQMPNINGFNRDVFIPALEAAGKSLKVSTYPGELHSFAFYDNAERTPRPAVALEAFGEIDAFFRQHVRTEPSPFDPSLVEHVPVETN